MYELKELRLMLTAQKRRLADLVEASGREDPTHPLQAFSMRRIAWLEEQIRQKQEKDGY